MFLIIFLIFWSLAAAGASLVLQMKKMKTGSMHMCWITMPGAGADGLDKSSNVADAPTGNTLNEPEQRAFTTGLRPHAFSSKSIDLALCRATRSTSRSSAR